MKYERLTERDENGVAIYKQKCNANDAYENFYIQLQREDAVLNRLAELEDKIENGTLIELPCKVGKILYEVCEKPNDNLFVKLPSEFFIVEHRVCDIKIRMIGKKPIFAIFTSNKEFGVMTWAGEHIGSQLFLTKAEAKKKLKELQGNEISIIKHPTEMV